MYQTQAEGHVEYVRALLGQMAAEVDPAGLELLRRVKMVANQYDAIAGERLRAAELSGPRLGLLLRLLAEEQAGGDGTGVSPTHLSRCQMVSKNTISALLRGLEEQGLIERELDAADKRVFRIRVSERGRALLKALTPEHLAYVNNLVADLSVDEKAELNRLLEKLHTSLLRHGEAAAVKSLE